MQTGLDLVDFPTIVWFETDYSVYTMRQASRRSWRIGQTQPVQVVFMAYRNTLQADALQLVAKKLQSSLAVEGELPDDGLAAYGDDGDDLMLALARKIVAGEEDAGSVESVFAQALQVAAEAEALLVDDGWAAPEPAAAVGRSGPAPTTTLAGRSGRCARGRNSWPGSRRSRSRGGGTRLPRCPSSSGRSSRSRRAHSQERPGKRTRGGHRRLRPVSSAPSMCGGFPRYRGLRAAGMSPDAARRCRSVARRV